MRGVFIVAIVAAFVATTLAQSSSTLITEQETSEGSAIPDAGSPIQVSPTARSATARSRRSPPGTSES
jgi:hypothetical protein